MYSGDDKILIRIFRQVQMRIKELIDHIIQKNSNTGIEVNRPASEEDIMIFEKQIGFALPNDFKEFYSTCNAFGCTEDIFNIVPLYEIRTYPVDYGSNWFYFAEYMIYCDMWGLRKISSTEYEIFNGSYPKLALTSSMQEFLERFLRGNVFDPGGLYDWHDEIGIK